MLGILLLIFSWIWVAEVLRRLQSDIAEFRAAKEFSERLSFIIIWLMSLFFVAVIVGWARVVFHAVATLFHSVPALFR